MNILTIIMQSDIVTAIASRLGDQLFSIVLLVGYAFYSTRKQKQSDERMDRYMAEDRERMMKVIENNTKVMERLEDHLDRR